MSESDAASAAIPFTARKAPVSEAVADVAREILALGIGRQKVTVLLWRKVEIAVELAATKKQVECALNTVICG